MLIDESEQLDMNEWSEIMKNHNKDYWFLITIVKNDKSNIQTYLVEAATIKGNCDSVLFLETA